MTISWRPIETAPKQQGVLVTSEFLPGWFEIGAQVLGEWRRGLHVSGDLMEHAPTHWAELTAVEKRRMS
jgi:hypothetical protein